MQQKTKWFYFGFEQNYCHSFKILRQYFIALWYRINLYKLFEFLELVNYMGNGGSGFYKVLRENSVCMDTMFIFMDFCGFRSALHIMQQEKRHSMEFS